MVTLKPEPKQLGPGNTIGKPGDTNAVSAVNTDVSEIGFIRASGKVLERCDACTKRTKLHEKEMAVMIEFHNNEIVLCALHESQLLERLIINHVKRTRKRAANGLKPDYYVQKAKEKTPPPKDLLEIYKK